MAAAQNAATTFVGRSGRTYNIDMYTADTAAYTNTWNPSGAAGTGSLPYWRCPEDVTLIDFAIPTGTTQTAMVLTENGAIKNGGVLRFAPFLNTINTRPKLSISFVAGTLIGATTL